MKYRRLIIVFYILILIDIIMNLYKTEKLIVYYKVLKLEYQYCKGELTKLASI